MTTDVVMTRNEKLLEEYLQYLRETKKSSNNTLQAYERDLNKFVDFLKISHIDDLTTISSAVIEDYKNAMTSGGFSPATVSRCLSAIRSMFQYLIMHDVVDSNPAREIHNEKFEKKAPQILTNKEIEILLSQPSSTDVKGIRDRAMLELLYATGIKVTELISLDVDDVNLQLAFIHCVKGEKERIISLYPLAVRAISNYLESSRKLLVAKPDERALFVNVSGERMTRQGFWKILKTYAESAKIYKEITPHTLRHSFAAHLLENGADIHDIQEILGHADISSTQRYAQFLKNKAKTSYIKFHPRA